MRHSEGSQVAGQPTRKAPVCRMPLVQTLMSRKSSITNAFVCSVIPVTPPTSDEVEKALSILGMHGDDLRCAYCGDRATEWDHLRPLVIGRRPTGYISEIANLVPACGKCNQSKGNKPWRQWIESDAKLSPAARRVPDLEQKIARLEAYERWKSPTKINFTDILGAEEWARYWSLCEELVSEMRQCQDLADGIRAKITKHVSDNIEQRPNGSAESSAWHSE